MSSLVDDFQIIFLSRLRKSDAYFRTIISGQALNTDFLKIVIVQQVLQPSPNLIAVTD